MKSFNPSLSANYKASKILLIEDNDDQWLIIQEAIRQCFDKVTVQRATSGDQALSLLTDWRYQEWEMPKLILLDLYLPRNTDGWQLLRQVKAMTDSIRRTPLIMLTASTSTTDITQAYELGISAYMVKPISFASWLAYFHELRAYWWETATLPPVQYGF